MIGGFFGGGAYCGPGTFFSWMGCGVMNTFNGVNPPSGKDGAFNFGSFHTGIAQFVKCDGSVCKIKTGSTWDYGKAGGLTGPSNDWYLFQQLGGYRDGFDKDT